MISLLTATLLATKLALYAYALPLNPRTVTSLNQAAVDEAHQHDNTATRAFTAIQMKTSTNQCFSVDPLSGDFRANLTPVQLVPCDTSSPNQKWDIITSGEHNNVPGFALIVSSLTNACLNFDPRRAAGNQVLLFSCGGRADGGGVVTDSQLFPFSAIAAAGPFVLTPKNSNNQTCFIPKGAALDQTACDAASPSAEELFTIGAVPGVTTVNLPTASTTPSVATVTTTTPAAITTIVATQTIAAVQSVSRAGGTLNPTAVAESQQRDSTATRAFTAAQIKSSAGQCLAINPNAGDFRQNLIPVELKACNAADPGQKFDVITKGKHNDQPGFALIVSSLTNGCLNFDPRRASGNQVLLFSCGGRADGGGSVTDSQLFPFSTTAGAGPFALTPKNSNNQTCLIPKGTVLDQTACNALAPSPQELFTIGVAAPAVPAANSITTTPPVVSTTPVASTTIDMTRTSASVRSVSRAGGRLNPTAVAESQQRDNTATRAFTAAQIKSRAGQCLTINPNSGDFRQNLIPVELKACNAADPGQKFDVITKGKHNDQPGFALIVSSLTNGCLNFDPRRAAGDQVILFSCGGRADGAGRVTDSQLFLFSSLFTGSTITLPLAPKNGKGTVCLADQGEKLGSKTCGPANAGDVELFTIA